MSTLAELLIEYEENCDYDDGAGDITKARAFRSTCRKLLVRMPSESGGKDSRTSMDVTQIKEELDKAVDWIGANDTTETPTAGRVLLSDVSGLRE